MVDDDVIVSADTHGQNGRLGGAVAGGQQLVGLRLRGVGLPYAVVRRGGVAPPTPPRGRGPDARPHHTLTDVAASDQTTGRQSRRLPLGLRQVLLPLPLLPPRTFQAPLPLSAR